MKTESISLIICVLFACCNKEPMESAKQATDCNKSSKPQNYLSAAYDGFLFDENSFWVYEEESSLIRDTVRVTESELEYWQPGPNGPGQGPGCSQQSCKITYSSTYHQSTYSESIQNSEICTGCCPYSGMSLFSYNFQQGQKNQPVVPMDITFDQETFSQLTKVHSSYNSGNKSYDKVYEVFVSDIEMNTKGIDQNKSLFYVNNIGVIRMETFSDSGTVDQVWNLLDHDVRYIVY